MEAMKKLMQKKKDEGKHLSPMAQKAKMDVLDHMQQMAGEEMSKKMSPLQKVSVAADSPEDLEDGLEHAKHLVHNMPEDLQSEDDGADDGEDMDHESLEGSPEEEASETPEDEMHEGHDMSDDEIDKQLAHLMALKAKKGMRA